MQRSEPELLRMENLPRRGRWFVSNGGTAADIKPGEELLLHELSQTLREQFQLRPGHLSATYQISSKLPGNWAHVLQIGDAELPIIYMPPGTLAIVGR